MDKRSKILIAISIVAIAISMAILYRNTMILQRFDIIETDSGIPEQAE